MGDYTGLDRITIILQLIAIKLQKLTTNSIMTDLPYMELSSRLTSALVNTYKCLAMYVWNAVIVPVCIPVVLVFHFSLLLRHRRRQY